MAVSKSGGISGIIPTVGRPDMLRLCLASVARQTMAVDEVVIVHCGDDAGTRLVAEDPCWRSAGLDCRYFTFPERHAAAQRNFAIQQARHDNLLLLDDDVELEPAWTEELFDPIWRDRSAGAAMGKLVNQPLDKPTFIWRLYRRLLPGERHAFEPGRLIGAAVPNGFPLTARDPMPAEWLGGGVAAMRRAAFVSIGGFAPYFSGSSPGEDLDLGYRMSRHWKVFYVPAARCVHHQDTAGRARSQDYQFQSIRSRYGIMVRAFGWPSLTAIAHLVYWMIFQSVSELAALRKGMRSDLLPAWWGRVRGIASCVGWTPPIIENVPAMFPAPNRE